MRICLVTRELAGFHGGGIGTYVALMARALSRAGHELHLLTDAHEGLVDGSRDPDGVQRHVVWHSHAHVRMPGYGTDQARYAMAAHLRLLELHAQHAFEFIEFPEYWGEGYFSLCAKRWMGAFEGATLAVRLHTPSRDVRELNRDARLDLAALEIDALEDASIRSADLVLSPTRSLLERTLSRVGREGPSAVVPHPFDDLWTAPPVSAGGLPAPVPTVLFIGRSEYRKGLHVLIRAAQLLLERGASFRVRMVGADTHTGPFGRSYRQWVRKQIEPRFERHFEFSDAVPRDALVEELRAAAVCCLPSVWENFPNVCLEAMSQQVAVVASDAGGMGEIIEPEKSGLLFRSGDAQHLAEQLERLLEDGHLRARLAAGAVQRVRTYCDPARIAAELTGWVAARPGPPERPRARSSATGTPAPDVSIVVPFYNLHAYLPETLASIASQTFRSFEVIVVNDGSTEPESLALLERLEREGQRVVHKRNGGLSSARNAGLAVARGRWILPLDADDLIAPTFLEKTVHALVGTPSLSYATTLVSMFEDGTQSPSAVWVPLGLERESLPLTNVASTCTAVLCRDAVERAGGYDEWLTSFEDWDLYSTMAEQGALGAIVPEFLFHYRVRPGSLVRTEVLHRRHELMAYLIHKHPALSLSPERTLRAFLGEHARALSATPLRYRAADAVNDTLKRLPLVHPILKRGERALSRLRGR